MPERTEIEAVWAEMRHALADARTLANPHDPKVKAYWHERIGLVLDRVRDARGDDEAARLRAAAKRVLEADMRGVRDLDALNALEDAAGFSQQGQRRAGASNEGGNQ